MQTRSVVHHFDAALNWTRFDRQIGDPSATHIGLKSRVEELGYPDGYELALAPELLERLSALGRVYGLGKVGWIASDAGAHLQPVEYSKLEAAYLAQQLRWLPKVSADPVLLRIAEPLAELAERCRSSQSRGEKLLLRFTG